MEENKIIDSHFIQDYISKVFAKKVRENNIKISDIAKKMWVSQPYISRILSWKDISLKTSKLEEIASNIGFSNTEFSELIRQAKISEFKHQYGEDIYDSYEKVDFRLALKQEYGINDSQALADIENFLQYIKIKYWDESK